VSSEAKILHADADAFFASVEQRDDPRLRGKPTIVGGGVVLAASYEARAYGVRGAMGGAEARRLCPQAIVVSPRFEAYVAASRELFEIFRQMAPDVEGISMEEAFLDVRGLDRILGAPREIAVRLRREVRERVGLPLSVGVARTKHLAKIASRAAKPDGLLVVEPRNELRFLRPLPVEELWGVGPKTSTRLHSHGIATVGQLADLDEALLISILGRAAGRRLHALANNRDPRRVRSGRRRRSIGSQSAFGRRPHTAADLDAIVVALVDRVARRMRAAGRVGRTIMLRLRFGDYSRASRSQTLPRPTASTARILAAERSLLATAKPLIRARGVTLLGITISNLEDARGGVQLELPLEGWRREALDRALDEVRERFGVDAVTRATLVGRNLRASVLDVSDEFRGRRRSQTQAPDPRAARLR
jgi:DNA polymerase IV